MENNSAHQLSSAQNMHSAHNINPAYILSIDINKIEEILKMWELLNDENKQKIIKKIIQVGGMCTHHPPVKKILINFANVLQNQNDCNVVYAIKEIGYIWLGKLIEFGMSKDTIKRSFNRLEEMGFIRSADSDELENSKLLYVFSSISHFEQAKIKTFTEYGELLFKKASLDVNEIFRNKVEDFLDRLKNLQPTDIKKKKIKAKIKKKRREDPSFKYWEKLNRYVIDKNIEERVLSVNTIGGSLGVSGDKIKKLEETGYIKRIATDSVVAIFRIKTLDELEKEGIL